jgi:CHAT domain-containing protein/Tfp pilus assembly protein PilF
MAMKKTAVFFVVLFLFLPFCNPRAKENGVQGIVVESIERSSAGEKAGIQPGDILLSWVRLSNPPTNGKSATGLLMSPFDLAEAEIDEAPKGTVSISLRRDAKNMSLPLPQGKWGIYAVPGMDAEPGGEYLKGLKLVREGKKDEGAAVWQGLAEKQARGKVLACWLYSAIARTFLSARSWDKAFDFYEKALNEARQGRDNAILIQVLIMAGDAYDAKNDFKKALACFGEALPLSGKPLFTAHILNKLASAEKDLGDRGSAEELHKKALAIREAEAPGSLCVAESLNNLGIVSHYRGNLSEARDYYVRSLAIKERIFPGSVDVAIGCNNLGVLEFQQGNLEQAESYHKMALEIREKNEPRSLRLASTYNNLGITYHEMGDLRKAGEFYSKALSIKKEIAPESVDTAITLNNVGLASFYRGDYASAEMSFDMAFEIYRKISYQGTELANALNNLGLLHFVQGDYEAADRFYRQALDLRNHLEPKSIDSATILHNLALIVRDKGDLSEASKLLQEALEIKEKNSPGSVNLSKTLNSLGSVAAEMGDFQKAEALFRQALSITGTNAPKSKLHAESLYNLGWLFFKKGDSSGAEDFAGRSLAIFSASSPGSWQEAEVMHLLGDIYKKRRDFSPALRFYSGAVEALETQKGRLGGGAESEERFSAGFTDYYRDLVEIQIGLKMQNEALHTLEMFRARALLNMLAERDLFFGKEIPEELISEQKRTDKEYDEVQSEIGGLDPDADMEDFRELCGKLAELREKRGEISGRIKESSPRLASLQYPEPLNLAGTEQLLGSGNLLLSYCCGADRTFLFTLMDNKLQVFVIPQSRDGLAKRVRYFRKLVSDPESDPSELTKSSIELFDTLLKPAGKTIKQAAHIIICPDFPLHYLPFSALKINKSEFLIEKKPLINIVSATVLNEIRKTGRNASGKDTLAAFGDPLYRVEEGGSGVLRSATNQNLSPLPNTRAEVENIAALYGRSSRVYLGADASEENARKNIADANYVHFACHGILNEKFPLDSALALAVPGETGGDSENGLLQAWEIFEAVRVSADLVTLSACETGLGKEMGGEGLIGLTRAFQFAGSKTVMSSLWDVSDESTAILMKSFYSHLKEKKTKAEALRLAQGEMIKSGKYSHPFYWGGFVLNGDWK